MTNEVKGIEKDGRRIFYIDVPDKITPEQIKKFIENLRKTHKP